MAFGAWIRKYFEVFKNTIGGTWAITSQSFTELNIKRGQQFYINEKILDIPASGGIKEFHFTIGPDPIILKNRIIKTNATDMDYEVFVGGDLVFTSAGTSVTTHNANATSLRTPQSQAFEDPTYTGTGFLNELDWIPGSEGVGNRSLGSFSTLGFEKVIPGNAEILARFTNNGSTVANVFYFLTFYEGDISPLNDEVLIP